MVFTDIGIFNSIKLFPLFALVVYDILTLSILNCFATVHITDFTKNHIYDYQLLADALGLEVSNIREFIQATISTIYNSCSTHFNSLLKHYVNIFNPQTEVQQYRDLMANVHEASETIKCIPI